MVLPSGAGWMIEEVLNRLRLLLSRQRPSATQKLEQRTERWAKKMTRKYLSHPNKSTNKRKKLHNRPIPSTDERVEELAYLSPPVPSRGNEFWELLPF